MKAELVKRKDRWDLYLIADGSKIASTSPNPMNKLSIKNCQAIENGYDLDELVEENFQGLRDCIVDKDVAEFYISLVKTTVTELLGDKKFSEDDVRKAYTIGWNSCNNFMEYDENHELIELPDCIQSLQQTEWDVEIEMICPHPEDTYVCGIQYGCDEDGCNNPNQIPYLDKNGCLILKRI